MLPTLSRRLQIGGSSSPHNIILGGMKLDKRQAEKDSTVEVGLVAETAWRSTTARDGFLTLALMSRLGINRLYLTCAE